MSHDEIFRYWQESQQREAYLKDWQRTFVDPPQSSSGRASQQNNTSGSTGYSGPSYNASYTPPAPPTPEELAEIEKQREQKRALIEERREEFNTAWSALNGRTKEIAHYLVYKKPNDVVKKLGYDPLTFWGGIRFAFKADPKYWWDRDALMFKYESGTKSIGTKRSLEIADGLLAENIKFYKRQRFKEKLDSALDKSIEIVKIPFIAAADLTVRGVKLAGELAHKAFSSTARKLNEDKWESDKKVIQEVANGFAHNLSGPHHTLLARSMFLGTSFSGTQADQFIKDLKNSIRLGQGSRLRETSRAHQKVKRSLLKLIDSKDSNFAIPKRLGISREEQAEFLFDALIDATKTHQAKRLKKEFELACFQQALTNMRPAETESNKNDQKQKRKAPQSRPGEFADLFDEIFGSKGLKANFAPAAIPPAPLGQNKEALIKAYESLILNDEQLHGRALILNLSHIQKYKHYLENRGASGQGAQNIPRMG